MNTLNDNTTQLSFTKQLTVGLKRFSRDYFIFFALIMLIVVFQIIEPLFLSTENILNMLRQGSLVGIVAAGMFFAILTSNIDLSVGSVVGLACVIYAMAAKDLEIPLFLAGILAMLCGIAVGVINGIFIAYGNIPAFIATLGTQMAIRGVAYYITNCYPITGLPANFKSMGRGFFLSIPIPVWLMFIVFIVATILFEKTKYGRNLYAIGGNKEAAYLSGIRVKKNVLIAYIICGALSAFAGLILASRLDAGQATAGIGYETEAITAVVIGGASMSGGKGKIVGVLLGSIFIAVLTNGMTLLDVNSYLQQILKGVVLLTAVVLDVMRNQKH